MKKLICVVCCMGMIAVTGCGAFKKGNTPEEVGKKYVEDRFKGNEFDLSSLEYSIIEQTDDKSIIKISGMIKFDKEIQLIKEGKNWRMPTESAMKK